VADRELFGTGYEMIPALRGERVRGQADTTRVAELGWQPERGLDEYVAGFLAANPR
jgi:UDP-glucose 4-epimerase